MLSHLSRLSVQENLICQHFTMMHPATEGPDSTGRAPVRREVESVASVSPRQTHPGSAPHPMVPPRHRPSRSLPSCRLPTAICESYLNTILLGSARDRSFRSFLGMLGGSVRSWKRIERFDTIVLVRFKKYTIVDMLVSSSLYRYSTADCIWRIRTHAETRNSDAVARHWEQYSPLET